MGQKSRDTIKTYFQTGDIPNQNQYVDLIDSFVSLTNDSNSGSITLTGSLNVSGTLKHEGGTFTSPNTIITNATLQDLTVNGTGSFSKITVGTGASEVSEDTGAGRIELAVMGDVSASGVMYSKRNVTNQFDIGTLNSENPLLKILAGFSSSTSVIGEGNPSIQSQRGLTIIINGGPGSGTPNWDTDTTGSFIIQQQAVNTTMGFPGVNTTNIFEIDSSGSIGLVKHITASGNISCSGTVIADNFTSTGGDDQITFDDNLFVKLHLTASGNISASGDIYAKSVSSSGNISAKEVIINRTDGGNPGLQIYHATENLLAQFESGDAQSLIEFKDNSTSDSILLGASGDDLIFRSDAGNFEFNSNNNGLKPLVIAPNVLTASSQIYVEGPGTLQNVWVGRGHITASHNISASGDVLTQNIYVGSGKNTDGIRINNESYITNINGLRLQANTQDPAQPTTPHVTVGLEGNLTASGNISASGTIIGNQIKIDNGSTDSTNQHIFDENGIHLKGDYLEVGGSGPHGSNRGNFSIRSSNMAQSSYPALHGPWFDSDLGLHILMNSLTGGTTGSFTIWDATGTSGFPGLSSAKIFEVSHAGNVTASGDMNVNGTIIANNFTSTGGDIGGISFTDGVNITGQITASGNISSSGTIYTNALSEGNSVNGLTLTGNITASGNMSLGGGDIIISSNIGNYKGVFTGTSTSDTLIAKLPTVNDVAVGNSAQSTLIYGSTTENGYGHGTGFSVILGAHAQTHTATSGDFKVSGNTNLTGNITASGGVILMTNLPTSNPGKNGQLYNDEGILKVSAG